MKRGELKRSDQPLKRSELRRETPLRSRSTKTAARDRLYARLREAFLEAHPVCARNVEHQATEVHHMAGRGQSVFFDQSLWRGLCRDCHQWATDNPTAAMELGLSVHRVGL